MAVSTSPELLQNNGVLVVKVSPPSPEPLVVTPKVELDPYIKVFGLLVIERLLAARLIVSVAVSVITAVYESEFINVGAGVML